jgi:hypothetical protein
MAPLQTESELSEGTDGAQVVNPANDGQQSLHAGEQTSYQMDHCASTRQPAPEPPVSPPFQLVNERKSYLLHDQILSPAPQTTDHYIDDWMNKPSIFAALLFGAWSIINWQSTVYANDIASQAVQAQIQANQLALYSFCALSLVFPPPIPPNSAQNICVFATGS